MGQQFSAGQREREVRIERDKKKKSTTVKAGRTEHPPPPFSSWLFNAFTMITIRRGRWRVTIIQKGLAHLASSYSYEELRHLSVSQVHTRKPNKAQSYITHDVTFKKKKPPNECFVAYASPSSIIVSNYTHAWIKKTPLIPKRRLSFWIWSKISCCFFAVGPNPLNAPSRRRWSEFNLEQEVTILWQKHQSLQLICADWVQPSLPTSLPPSLPRFRLSFLNAHAHLFQKIPSSRATLLRWV